MSNNDIKKALDEAELFLRNRTMDGMSLELNEYDIGILQDISKVCARAYDEITSQKADIGSYKETIEQLNIALNSANEEIEEKSVAIGVLCKNVNDARAEIERLKEHCSKCGEKTTKTILHLQETITEKRAEIERLTNSRAKWKQIATDFDKASRETEKEIERLQKAIMVIDVMKEQHERCLKKAKAEAIKELMFNLDEEISTYSSNGKDLNVYAWLKNYAKEMVGVVQ